MCIFVLVLVMIKKKLLTYLPHDLDVSREYWTLLTRETACPYTGGIWSKDCLTKEILIYTTVNNQEQAFCKGIFILEENTAKTRRALQFDFDTWILSHCIIITLNVARYVQKERMTQNL